MTGLKFNKEYFVIMIVLNSILLGNIRYFVSKICKMYYADFDWELKQYFYEWDLIEYLYTKK